MHQVLSFGHQNGLTSTQGDLPYEVLHLHEGELLFKEGDPPRGLYYVHSGCMKMIVNRPVSRGRTTTPEYVTKLVSPGEYFGYKALVRNGNHRGSATAIQTTTVWVYPKELVHIALKNSSPLVNYLLRQAVTDLDSFEQDSQLNYLASVQERIAHQLIVLADKFGQSRPEGISLNLKLTRNEFAQLASTINESLSRHLTEFKTEGLIEVNGKEILIKDLEGLRRKSGS